MSVPHVVVGEIALRPTAGPPIPAQLIKLHVRISPESESSDQSAEFIELTAAACDQLHDEVILSEPTFNRLIDSSCHRDVNLSDVGDSPLAGDIQTVTRSMSRAGPTVDADSPRLVGDENNEFVAESSDVTIAADDNKLFVNPDDVSMEMIGNDSSDVAALINEQSADDSLKTAISLARRRNCGYSVNKKHSYSSETRSLEDNFEVTC